MPVCNPWKEMKNKVLWAKLYLLIHKQKILKCCLGSDGSPNCNSCIFGQTKISCIGLEEKYLWDDPSKIFSPVTHEIWVKYIQNIKLDDELPRQDVKTELNKLNAKRNNK